MGATRLQVLLLLIQEFVKPVVWSLLLALPVAFYVKDRFLAQYPYQVPVTWLAFLAVGGMLALLVAVVVVWQGSYAAARNPVESLKTE
ncbi:MAG: hypothetical protein ACOYXA_17085 [Bacteroidota bacterium]